MFNALCSASLAPLLQDFMKWNALLFIQNGFQTLYAERASKKMSATIHDLKGVGNILTEE